MSQPGRKQPGSSYDATETVGASAAAIDGVATIDLGVVAGKDVTVEEVRVEATAADFDFNIEANGNDVFSAEQSPSGTSEEVFRPDQNARAGGDEAVDFEFDVSSASGTGSATASVAVVVTYNSTL